MAESNIWTSSWIDTGDGARLFVRRWIPGILGQGSSGDSPLAVLHIIHGMAEHSLRYDRLARRLGEQGIEVWAADQRGHGKTADPAVNDPGRGGLLGHCADREGFFKAAADIDRLTTMIKETYPRTPLFLLGHSWGSFIAQAYIEAHSERLSGCILSGTRGPDGLKITLGVPIMALIAALRGCRNGSRLAYALGDGSYNKSFRPNRTAFDWLSRDEKEVDAYVSDPFSGNLCSSGFYRDLLGGLKEIHRPKAMDNIRRDLPIYIFSGSADPVGDMGQSPVTLVNAYRSMGIQDLEFVLYPDARHETLNETNREEVTGNLLAWLLRHCGVPSA